MWRKSRGLNQNIIFAGLKSICNSKLRPTLVAEFSNAFCSAFMTKNRCLRWVSEFKMLPSPNNRTILIGPAPHLTLRGAFVWFMFCKNDVLVPKMVFCGTNPFIGHKLVLLIATILRYVFRATNLFDKKNKTIIKMWQNNKERRMQFVRSRSRTHFDQRHEYKIYRNFSTEKKPASSFFTARTTVNSIGIVGMPNIGKSTLFNAVTASQVCIGMNA